MPSVFVCVRIHKYARLCIYTLTNSCTHTHTRKQYNKDDNLTTSVITAPDNSFRKYAIYFIQHNKIKYNNSFILKHDNVR